MYEVELRRSKSNLKVFKVLSNEIKLSKILGVVETNLDRSEGLRAFGNSKRVNPVFESARSISK